MIFEISHTQHPTTKTMYIFSLIQIKTTTTIPGVSITPTTSCGQTELKYLYQLLRELLLSSSAVHGSVFIRRISGVLGLRSLVPESSERWEICKLWFIAAHGS